MRSARLLGVLRREKTLALVVVLAPALLMLAMAPLALLRPAAAVAPVRATPSAIVSPPASYATMSPSWGTPPGMHRKKMPGRTGDDGGVP